VTRPTTRRLTSLALAFACAFFISAQARADENSFASGTLELGADAVTIELTARSNLGFPSISSEEGFIRVRFPDMTGWTHLDMEGDGTSVRFAHVRPGASNSGVLVVRVGDLRVVPQRAVDVRVDGAHATVSIDRSFLPGSPNVRVAAVAAEPAETPRVEAAHADATPVPNEAAAVAEPAALADVAPSVEPSTAPAAEPTRLTSSEAPQTLPTLGMGQRGTSLTTLLGLTAVLGLTLIGVHLWKRRRAGAVKAPIRVMAAHRLGPKQQLVVVRALGQDHFLSVDGAHTERLLSVPADESEPEPSPERALSILGLGGAAPSERREEVPRITLTRPAQPEPVKSAAGTEAASRFGAQLLKIAADQSKKPAAAVTPSEAVAGLVALRARAGR
jgi:flagellar biogenesis protein FliO